jgi:two-component system, cell cycle response regulator DivK
MSTATDARPAVLIVEDNETIRGAFAILLEESGYRVLQAGLGADAVRLAAEHLPNLVLMDLNLPDFSGLEVTRRIKADEATRHIPVVALTGRALDADIEACRVAGCSAYLIKPIDTSRLLGEIATWVNRHPA